MIELSIIVPTWNDADCLRTQLQILPRLVDPHAVEIVVVDGGSRDETCALAAELGRVIFTPRGRAAQMNAGARVARGECLLFLHPDTVLPPDALSVLRRTLRRRDIIGGCFRKEPFRRNFWLWLADFLTSLRLDLYLTLYGDRAIFVRRRAFMATGGFDERLHLLEDVDLGRRLRRLGGLTQVPSHVRSLARQPARISVTQTLLLRLALEMGYRLGFDVTPLARRYDRER